MNEVASSAARPFRILTLDGGGAKGFYTLGVLKEIEALIQTSLHERFDLVFGTSTGAIIAALLALGKGVDDIHKEYRGKVPEVMRAYSRAGKSRALARLAVSVFGDATFSDARIGLGIVAARWDLETPMIFKRSVDQAHGRRGSFVPGFGCTISEAVQASCSAYPFFERKVLIVQGSRVEVIDGGYCANNPTLYAIADALMALGREPASLRVISVVSAAIRTRNASGSAHWWVFCRACNCFKKRSTSTRTPWIGCGPSFSKASRRYESATPSRSRRWPPIFWSTISESWTCFTSKAENPLRRTRIN